jgi:hypothetical protein
VRESTTVSGKRGTLGGGGGLEENTFLIMPIYQIMKLSCCLITRSLCTRLSRQAGLMLVVRYQEDAYSELRLAIL